MSAPKMVKAPYPEDDPRFTTWLLKQRPGERYTGTCSPDGTPGIRYGDVAGYFEWLKEVVEK